MNDSVVLNKLINICQGTISSLGVEPVV